MVKTVLVTGKNGQLGQSLQRLTADYPHYRFVFAGRAELDLSTVSSIAAYFSKNWFDAIINCAAYTAVDQAELEPELADQVNHQAVAQLARIAQQQGSALIHISTDYVFDGTAHRPYREDDASHPQNVYGDSKLKGEQAIKRVNPRGAIIRTSWVYSEFGNNFVKTMLRLGRERDSLCVIFDQIGTPTYATDLARMILDNLTQMAQQSVQIYHYSNEGVCSWYDFAKAVFELNAISCNVTPIETKDYPTPAKRPYYSLMNKGKIKQAFPLDIPYWRDSLKTCLQRLEQ